MDLGAGRRGVDMGPSAIRIAGLNQSTRRLGFEVSDSGNINVRPPESMKRDNSRCYYLPEIASACEAACRQSGVNTGRRGCSGDFRWRSFDCDADRRGCCLLPAEAGSETSELSGWMRIQISTHRKAVHPEMFTECRLLLCSDMARENLRISQDSRQKFYRNTR